MEGWIANMAVITSIDDVQPFLNRDFVESDLGKLQKSELLLIAEYGSLDVRVAMKKQEALQKVREHLEFAKDASDSDGEDLGSVKSPAECGKSSEEKTKISKAFWSESVDCELEKLKLQFQLKQLEWAEREKEREREREREKEREKEREYEERIRKEEREHELALA